MLKTVFEKKVREAEARRKNGSKAYASFEYGLRLKIQGKRKVWEFRSQGLRSGKETLGEYPEMSISDAEDAAKLRWKG